MVSRGSKPIHSPIPVAQTANPASANMTPPNPNASRRTFARLAAPEPVKIGVVGWFGRFPRLHRSRLRLVAHQGAARLHVVSRSEGIKRAPHEAGFLLDDRSQHCIARDHGSVRFGKLRRRIR